MPPAGLTSHNYRGRGKAGSASPRSPLGLTEPAFSGNRKSSFLFWYQLEAHNPLFAADVEQAVRNDWRRPAGILQERLLRLRVLQLHLGNEVVFLRVHLQEPKHAVFTQ